MPYIKQSARKNLEFAKNPGELNYLFTKISHQYLRDQGLCYQNINDVIGALEAAKLELYRRIVAPYEDSKIIENGDMI